VVFDTAVGNGDSVLSETKTTSHKRVSVKTAAAMPDDKDVQLVNGSLADYASALHLLAGTRSGAITTMVVSTDSHLTAAESQKAVADHLQGIDEGRSYSTDGWDTPAKKPTPSSDKVKREECKAWFMNAKGHKCYMKGNGCPEATAPRMHAGHT
jgi:hypothetical protein